MWTRACTPAIPMELEARYARQSELFLRAQRLIPGGHHLSGRPLGDPSRTPTYMERGRGSRVWDADGNEYVDFVMAFGPFLLGYAHPEVDGAAIQQLARGGLLSMNHPLHLELVEALIARFPGAEMGTFFRTGSEATTAALRIARRATGRRVVARCGYHGWHDWCLPLEDFVPAGLERQVLEFHADEPATLATLFDERPGEIACVILAPEMIEGAAPERLREIAAITRAGGAVFVLDEVKTAFRISPGSVQQRAGVVPDLTTLSKALGNGWPVAALVGSRDVMRAGAGMHYSATYHGETAAMAAALATLAVVDREEVAAHVWRLGEQLIGGLGEIARRHGVAATAYGEPLPPMPFLRFHDDHPARNAALRERFYEAVLARGVLLHPRHMWFVSHAHDDADVTRALEACDAAMKAAAHG